MTVILKEPLEKVSVRTLEEIKRDTAALEVQDLSDSARLLVAKIRARLEDLRLQLDPRLRLEKAGERMVVELQRAEGGAWSGAELKAKFKLMPAVLYRRRKEHRIVYWRDAQHNYLYPRWQFNEAGALLPGIQETLQIFKSDDEWRVMRYFLGVRKQLDDRRPLDLLQSGEAVKVIAHARDHAAENTW